MLNLLLKITVAWFSISLLGSALWALLIELALRLKARRAPAFIGTSTQTLSEQDVEALLTTPAASDAIGTHDATSQRVRKPMLAKVRP